MYMENHSDACRPEKGAESEKACGYCRKSWGLQSYPLAIVYAPIQQFEEILDPDEALHSGTAFGALDLPFLCGGEGKGGCCRD